jgi:hypothetical protein
LLDNSQMPYFASFSFFYTCMAPQGFILLDKFDNGSIYKCI